MSDEVARLRARVTALELELAVERAARRTALLEIVAQSRLLEQLLAERIPPWPTIQ